MQTVLEQTLPSSGTISRKTSSPDSIGEMIETWANVGTVSCRISPLDRQAGGEGVTAERLTTTREVIVTIPAETTLYSYDRIVSGGSTYEVQNIRAPRSWEISRRAECVEVS